MTTAAGTEAGPVTTPDGAWRPSIPGRVADDTAYQHLKRNSDKQNARIEHDKALARVMTAVC